MWGSVRLGIEKREWVWQSETGVRAERVVMGEGETGVGQSETGSGAV